MDRIWERFSLNEAFIRIIIKSYHKNNMKICTDWCHSSLRINNNFHNWSDVWRIWNSLTNVQSVYCRKSMGVDCYRILCRTHCWNWRFSNLDLVPHHPCILLQPNQPPNLYTQLNANKIFYSSRYLQKKTSHVCCGPKPLYKHKMLHWRIIHVNALI